jgi:hypothetical protein
MINTLIIMRTWLKGGLIILGISTILLVLVVICFFMNNDCREEWCGIECLFISLPFLYIIKYSGFEYFLALLDINIISGVGVFVGYLIIILLGFFIVFLFDKEIDSKKKLILSILLILIIAFLLANNYYLKENDKKLLSEREKSYNDFSYCEKLSVFSKNKKILCLRKDPCNLGNVPITNLPSKCITELAVRNNDTSLCDFVYEKEDCVREIAIIYELCDLLINDTFYKPNYFYNKCLFEKNIDNLNISFCKNLQNIELDNENSFKDRCFKKIAIELNELEFCNLIESDNFKKECTIFFLI